MCEELEGVKGSGWDLQKHYCKIAGRIYKGDWEVLARHRALLKRKPKKSSHKDKEERISARRK